MPNLAAKLSIESWECTGCQGTGQVEHGHRARGTGQVVRTNMVPVRGGRAGGVHAAGRVRSCGAKNDSNSPPMTYPLDSVAAVAGTRQIQSLHATAGVSPMQWQAPCNGKHRAHTCGRAIGQRKRRSPLAKLENELAFSKPGPLMQRGCCEGCLRKGRQIQGLQDDLAEYRLVNKFRLEMARGLGVTQFYENFVWAQWLPTQQRFARTSHPPTQHDNEEGAEGGLGNFKTYV